MFCPQCGQENTAGAEFCQNCGYSLTGIPDSRRIEYAGFWLRFVAWIIDYIIISIASFILYLPSLFMYSDITLSELPTVGFYNMIVGIAVPWLYYAIMESSSKQATLGKMVIGVIVTDESGNRISFARATGRHFSKILSGIILLIGYIMIAFTGKKQGLHDIIAATLVVKK